MTAPAHTMNTDSARGARPDAARVSGRVRGCSRCCRCESTGQRSVPPGRGRRRPMRCGGCRSGAVRVAERHDPFDRRRRRAVGDEREREQPRRSGHGRRERQRSGPHDHARQARRSPAARGCSRDGSDVTCQASELLGPSHQHLLGDGGDVQFIGADRIARHEPTTTVQAVGPRVEPVPLRRIGRPLEPHGMVEARALEQSSIADVPRRSRDAAGALHTTARHRT